MQNMGDGLRCEFEFTPQHNKDHPIKYAQLEFRLSQIMPNEIGICGKKQIRSDFEFAKSHVSRRQFYHTAYRKKN